MDLKNIGQPNSPYKIDKAANAYIAYTDHAGVPEDSSAFVSWRALIRRAARDPAREGIIVNPHRKTSGGGPVHLDEVTLRLILLHAEDKMQGEAPRKLWTIINMTFSKKKKY